LINQRQGEGIVERCGSGNRSASPNLSPTVELRAAQAHRQMGLRINFEQESD